ncbi:type II CAAX endopeptidase family protein [Mucilaginibacter ginsenosidivorans]|uniref:CPBP family intramembrane metalloprotease n=1 Tax=Mucilaginibacter ginsenosidivorans TaxID=398053 RepID=A0A5B8UZ00_9SPHI|nr:type II CAAX endopeptidase family protein [Mucilaginibacter ginsenosidivorans]QEC64188.1 CPBP family intramembrane metalloprotease [Mucilaginibacter ginsenosidivorans]
MADLTLINDADESQLPHCGNCDRPVYESSRFCSHCGHAIILSSESSTEEKWRAIKQAALFFAIHAVACCVFSFVDYFKTFTWSIVIDVFLAAVAVVFFFINWSKLKSVFLWHSFSVLKLLGYCAIAVGGSFVVNFVVRWLNRSLFSTDFSYYEFYASHKNSVVLAIFFVAVMPALFEELGYRGFLLGKLMLVTDTKQAIFISSFVFAIMHRSVISLFWLIPFALLLGHVRTKEKTLWYGVCMHFCFNFTAIMLEIIQWNHHL